MDKEIFITTAEALLDEQGQKSGWYKQIVARVDFLNGNDRIYPKKVYEDALKVLKAEGFPYAGEHPHPQHYKGHDEEIHFQCSIPNSAVKFREAYIDEMGNVWAEYMPLDTEMGRQVKAFLDNALPFGFSNRMTGETRKEKRNGKIIDVAKKLKLFTWDIVLNPAEEKAFGMAAALTDSHKEEKENMDFFKLSLTELEKWKKENKNAQPEEAALCDQVIALKKEAQDAKQKAQALTDEINGQKEKEEAQQFLLDEVEKLNYDETAKKALLTKGAEISNKGEVRSFLEKEKTFLDALRIEEKLNSLGMKTKQGKAKAFVTEGEEHSIVDAIMEEMDRELQKKDAGFQIEKEIFSPLVKIVLTFHIRVSPAVTSQAAGSKHL